MSPRPKVSKFGGSSVANAGVIRRVAEIVKSDPSRKYVVVSAPGKDSENTIKVTDMLISLAEEYCKGNSRGSEMWLKKLSTRYYGLAGELGIENELVTSLMYDLQARVESYDGNRLKYLDSIKAFGEEACARMVARFFKNEGINAQYVDPKDTGFIVTDTFGNSQLAVPLEGRLSESMKEVGAVTTVVFPGFFGYTENGDIATFSRGGSDLTGAILAAAVDAEVYENFTDVDGIFRADPGIVDSPELIQYITYGELRELSYMGFNVFHDEAIFPVIKRHIPTHLKNTNNPGCHGTHIVGERIPNDNEIVTGIACKKGFCSVDVSKYLMNREIGFMRKALQIFEDENISVEHVPSGIDSISVIFEQQQLNNGMLDRLVRRMYNELGVEDVKVRYNNTMVIAVGYGMVHRTGVAERLTGACAREGINIEMINQGSSEMSVVIGVSDSDAEKTVRAVYNEFYGKQKQERAA